MASLLRMINQSNEHVWFVQVSLCNMLDYVLHSNSKPFRSFGFYGWNVWHFVGILFSSLYCTKTILEMVYNNPNNRLFRMYEEKYNSLSPIVQAK